MHYQDWSQARHDPAADPVAQGFRPGIATATETGLPELPDEAGAVGGVDPPQLRSGGRHDLEIAGQIGAHQQVKAA